MAEEQSTQGAPEESGAQEDQGEGLYDLNSVPPELRSHVEPHLKAIGANADKKLREAADYRKQWEPFEQLGVQDMDPETLEGLISFAQMASDEDQFAEWFGKAGEEAGLFEKLGYSKADELEGEGDFGDLSPEKIQELVTQAVQSQMAPVQEALTAQQSERQEAEVAEAIDQAWDEIAKEHDLPDEAREDILRFAYSYAEDLEDPREIIEAGYKDFARVIAQAEQGLLGKKAGQPSSPEGPGGAAASRPEPITTFEGAKEAARERLRAAT